MKIVWLTAFLDTPAARFEERTRFWADITGWGPSPFRGDALQFATLQPGGGDPVLRVQRVVSGPGGVHLDLHVDSTSEAVERAEDLGAERAIEMGPRIMRSPAGMTFCVVPDSGESCSPNPKAHPLPQRIDPVSIDVPSGLYDAEIRFWSDLTGWGVLPTSRSEFTFLERPASMPFRLLLQGLGGDDPGSSARAHIDIAAGERRSELVAHHVQRGATVIAEFEYWTTLADAAGYPYCITARDPLSGSA